MDSEGEKLDALSERIRKASDARAEKKAETETGAGRVGFDFVGSVIGSGIVGGIIDHEFGTSPWWLIAMIVIGFAVGVWSAWRSMQKSDKST